MLFKIGDNIIDPNETPCAIIFENNEEAVKVGNIISTIPESEETLKWFAVHSKGFDDKFLEWSNPTEEILSKMHGSPDTVTHHSKL